MFRPGLIAQLAVATLAPAASGDCVESLADGPARARAALGLGLLGAVIGGIVGRMQPGEEWEPLGDSPVRLVVWSGGRVGFGGRSTSDAGIRASPPLRSSYGAVT